MSSHNNANGNNTVPSSDDIIHLKVRSQDDDEVFFKIKRTTQLKKLMDKYCERQGVTFNF